jgi:hypothetical protein
MVAPTSSSPPTADSSTKRPANIVAGAHSTRLDGARRAAERAIREPLAGESRSVPEADDARVVEHVRVLGAARVTGKNRPDRVDGELRVWMSVEDVRADPTGPELADASGRRDEQDQPLLARARVEQRSQLPDVAQIGELPQAARGCARRWTRCARLPRLRRLVCRCRCEQFSPRALDAQACALTLDQPCALYIVGAEAGSSS